MNIELTKVKIHPDMSEETNCFSATICVDGKPIGDVRNDGRGGCNFYHWTNPTAGKQLTEWANKQSTGFEFEKLDQIIDQYLQKSEITRWLKRNTSKKTLFRLHGDKKGAWRIVKSPFSASVKQFLLNKYKDIQCIANESLEVANQYC